MAKIPPKPKIRVWKTGQSNPTKTGKRWTTFVPKKPRQPRKPRVKPTRKDLVLTGEVPVGLDLPRSKLDFWIDNNLNVCFTGLHGIGKTQIIKKAFKRKGINMRYFSASTMDPWTDLIGIPKEMEDEQGEKYLDFVRPREFKDDEVEAIFLDEFNRAEKKVRNAVMELIQFKSINGRKFSSLRMVWIAINPHTEEGDYDVEKLDPAQFDRFQVHIELPYAPARDYLVNKYKKYGVNVLNVLRWWYELPVKEQLAVSPRRLDYAISMHVKGGDVADVLPLSANVSKFKEYISGKSIPELLEEVKNMNPAKLRKFLTMENWIKISKYLESDTELADRVLQQAGLEQIASALKDKKGLRKMIQDGLNGDNQNLICGCLEYLNAAFEKNPKLSREDNALALSLMKLKPDHIVAWVLGVSKVDKLPKKGDILFQPKNGLGSIKLDVVLTDEDLDKSLNIYLEAFNNLSTKTSPFIMHVDYVKCFIYATLGVDLTPSIVRSYLHLQTMLGQDFVCNPQGVGSSPNIVRKPRVVRGLGQIMLMSMVTHGWIKNPQDKARKSKIVI